VNDVDRWADLEGPEPRGVRELLDAAEAPDLAPEEQARLDRELYAAIAEDRRRRARDRSIKPVLGGLFAAACLAGVVFVALRPAPVSEDAEPTARHPPSPGTAASSDAGAPHRPGVRSVEDGAGPRR